MRGEFDRTVAVDGHAGCILRAYRDHQMSRDSEFLKRNWASIKKAVQYLIRQDGNGDGILEGAQHNTLDAAWYGKIPWLSSLYLASLHAGEAMAIEMGDTDFAARCRTIHTAGMANFVKEMWKPEYGYFIQVADPAYRNKVGAYDGCEISQVFGQHWAFQVGLGRVLPVEQTKAALASFYKFNFTMDVGPYRQVQKSGRWYAMPGEGGVIGCTWPFGEETRVRTDYDYYFNECQNGYEFQPAAHMIWEGMVLEGLVIGRSLFERYHARKRNPWNEVECGDHYARSMASYGLFTAACGYEYHGPKGYLAFAPRVTPEDFRAAFTSAEGWGRFSQKITGLQQTASLEIKWGKLRLKTLGLAVKAAPASVRVQVNGQAVPASSQFKEGRVLVTFDTDLHLTQKQQLLATLT
jgi:non-lysosomal glucosylceramidase